jgi:hypothetical protein
VVTSEVSWPFGLAIWLFIWAGYGLVINLVGMGGKSKGKGGGSFKAVL